MDGEDGEISGHALRVVDPAKLQGKDRVIAHHDQMEDKTVLDQLARKQHATPNSVQVIHAKMAK